MSTTDPVRVDHTPLVDVAIDQIAAGQDAAADDVSLLLAHLRDGGEPVGSGERR